LAVVFWVASGLLIPSGSDFWGETKEKRAFEDRHENTKVW